MCSVRVVLCWVSSVVFIVLCVVCVLCVVWCVFCSGWCLLCCVLCCVCCVLCIVGFLYVIRVVRGMSCVGLLYSIYIWVGVYGFISLNLYIVVIDL